MLLGLSEPVENMIGTDRRGCRVPFDAGPLVRRLADRLPRISPVGVVLIL